MSYKYDDHTCNNTLVRIRNDIDNVRVNNAFSYLTDIHFEGDKISYYKENLTLMVISYENYETRRRLV